MHGQVGASETAEVRMVLFLRPNARGHAVALLSGDQGKRAVRSGQAGAAVLTSERVGPCSAHSASAAQREVADELERLLQPRDRQLVLSTCRAADRPPSERTTR